MPTFKTRARTIDMLGRQQIAGIPTAISELFKNAHDAYADRVEIDYYRSDGLFVLRDDGIGMTRDDFLSRWLTIGTESKFDTSHGPPRDPDKDVRPMLGEKGIGRLAIATIGPQVLVLTRPKSPDATSDLTAAFINWSVFEWPGIDLDEVDIPLRSFSGGTLPSADDVAQMVNQFRTNCTALNQPVDEQLRERLDRELSTFDADPQQIDSYLGAPSLLDAGCGTHFIIKPSSELLPDDIDGDPTTQKASPLRKALLGFTNTMAPDARQGMQIAFHDHKTEELSEDLLAGDEFFTPSEFVNADHRIRGRFDAHGQFQGEFSIYGEIIQDHLIPWPNRHGRRTDCGPFTIDFAAFEGEPRHSTIPPEEHAIVARKAEQLGALYIYRNGIRILPYGDTDYDWLDIEYRRTKSAYYYYFSHRKMFGFLEIDSDANHGLREKAGREGFQENRAYRQFKAILRNFFLQVAADFFRGGVHGDAFDLRKQELSREDQIRKRRVRQVAARKKRFEESLHSFFTSLEKDEPQEQALALTESIAEELQSACGIPDKQTAAHRVLQLERRAHADLRKLEDQYRVSRPRIGLSKAALRDWGVYASQFSTLQETVFGPARQIIHDIVGEEAASARLAIDLRIRTEAALEDLGKEARKTTGDGTKAVRDQADKVAQEVRGATLACLRAVDTELRLVLTEFQRTDLSDMPDVTFVKTRDSLERRILSVTEEQSTLLATILDQLQAVDVTGESSTAEQLMAIEQRNILLEEETEADLQLAQLGMAVEIINHEFSGTIRAIRDSLRRLKAWADVNEGLADLYDGIRTSFDHLDGYLTLFTPLQRRLYRKEVEILGSEIHDFLDELFRARFERHDISFSQTHAFKKCRVIGFPSSFYPVFVNLVDNAVFWLSQQAPRLERRLWLDEHDGSLLVQDSGPGVDIRDREAIFEFGFTRKPGGRGLGLHISRESLRRVGYELELVEADDGATFAIRPANKEG